jgi:hypothetical protein
MRKLRLVSVSALPCTTDTRSVWSSRKNPAPEDTTTPTQCPMPAQTWIPGILLIRALVGYHHLPMAYLPMVKLWSNPGTGPGLRSKRRDGSCRKTWSVSQTWRVFTPAEGAEAVTAEEWC